MPTSLQLGMVYHAFTFSDSDVDIEQVLITDNRIVNSDTWHTAWCHLLAKHAVLRAAFSRMSPHSPLLLTVLDSAELPWQHLDIPPENIDDFLAQDRQDQFDLSHQPLLRFTTWVSNQKWHCLWSFHHSILDGRSFPLLLQEAYEIYAQLETGNNVFLQPPEPSFCDYLNWNARQNYDVSKAHWQTLLTDFTAPTPLNIGTGTDSTGRYAVEKSFSLADTNLLTAFAKANSLSLNTLLQGAWGLLLMHYSACSHAVFGNTRACRHNTIQSAEDIVGLFINTIPVFVSAENSTKLLDYLSTIRQQHINVRAHERTPLSNIQQWSNLEDGTPLFETLVVYEKQSLNAQLQALGGDWSERNFAYRGKTNFPLALIGYGDAEMLLRLEYVGTRFSEADADRILGHVCQLLSNFAAADAETLALRIPYLQAAEKHQLIHDWNPIQQVKTDGRTLHDRFASQAAATPTAIAVSFENQTLTYAQLEEQANHLAAVVSSVVSSENSRIGLCVERSLDIPIGILGILKAGASYVPLDPASPAERQQFIVEDADLSLIITRGATLIDALPSAQTIDLDQLPVATFQPRIVSAESLAYIIYTSGSTGKPKGVKVTHANVTRLFDATDDWFSFVQTDVWTLFHSFAFDFSVWELWGALLHGGRLVIVPYWISRDPDAFRQLLTDKKVTVLNQTPSAFRQLISADSCTRSPLYLRSIIFGGEALELGSLTEWLARHGDAQPALINMYGITETTVHVTYRRIFASDVAENKGSIIGRPIPDLQTYVLDAALEPLPIGVAGEIYVGGAGVASGYLNRPNLTAERFVNNPFTLGTKLYKTGDMARFLPSGDLEYIGRSDQQVKIRGFRIELGEIEAAIRQHKSLQDVVVIATDSASKTKQLIAYIIESEPVDFDELRAFIARKLPAYMIPAHFVTLDQFPLTNNGKLNVRALSLPARPRLQDKPTVPRNAIETTLCSIWAHVLQIETVGIHDNYFAIGGDSILSMQLIVQIRAAGWHVSPQDIFQQPTVAQLATVAQPVESDSPAEDVVENRPIPLTPIQQWFFNHRFANPHHWNQAYVFNVKQAISAEKLTKAIATVIQNHAALRLSIVQTNEGWQQTYQAISTDRFTIRYIDLRGEPAKFNQTLQDAQASLSISNRLVSVVYAHIDSGDKLFIAVHHLAIDGVSWRILLDDLATLFDEKTVPASTATYQQWAQHLSQVAQSPKLAEELTYWQDVIGAESSVIPHDTDGLNLESSVQTIATRLDVLTTTELLGQTAHAYNTQINDLLLTALAYTLAEWTNRPTNQIDLEGHGREAVGQRSPDISRTVGWFTAIFPVLLCADGASWAERIIQIKEMLRSIPNKGIGYGMLAQYTNDLPKQAKNTIAFNYLGQFDQTESSWLSFSNELPPRSHAPENERTHLLEIIAQIRGGQLEVAWHYSQNRHHAETVEHLAMAFDAALKEIITHCQTQSATRHTPSDFPLAQITQGQIDALGQRYPSVENIFPLSPIQHLFYTMDSAESALGFEQWHFKLTGSLDIARYEKAWQLTVQQHPMLRTIFVADGFDEPQQIVLDSAEIKLNYQDITSQSSDQQANTIAIRLADDRENPFDLTQAPLMRLTLFQTAIDAYQLVWCTHHLQIDGWSWPLIFASVATSYQTQQTITAPSYSHYIRWLQTQQPAAAESFWRAHLARFAEPTPLVGMGRFASNQAFAQHEIMLSAESTLLLKQSAETIQITVSTLAQAAWGLLLAHSSQKKEIVWGTTVSGRSPKIPHANDIIGPFVNNLPVHVKITTDALLKDWLVQLQTQQLEIAQYQQTPLDVIQACSDLPLHQRLFQSLVVFQNYDKAGLESDSYQVEVLTAPQATNYPLTLVVTPSDTYWQITLIYHPKRFSTETAQQWLDNYRALLEAIGAQPNGATIGQLLASLSLNWPLSIDNAHKKSAHIQPATNDTEHKLLAIWKSAFGRDQISIHDNFFDLGGHSLMVASVHEKIEQIALRKLPVTTMFQYPTIHLLAAFLNGDSVSSTLTLTPSPRSRAERIRQARARRPKR